MNDSAPALPYACPVCAKRFRTTHGRGGHLAVKQDTAHIAHRLRTDPNLRTPPPVAPPVPAKAAPPPQPEPAPPPTLAPQPRPATPPAPADVEPSPAPAGVDVQAMLDHYANIWTTPNTDIPVEAPRFEVPELEGASPFVRGLFIILTILASGFGLYFLVQSKRGAKAAQAASRTVRPAAPTMDESEAYWRTLLGNAAFQNPRRRGGNGGWP